MNLQERGTLIVGPAEEVYEGMIVGENARAEEMDVNPTKEKKLNNIRSATAEDFERLTPAMTFSLEHALEFISEDECVEVTPKAVRLRKVLLDQATRGRLRSRARDAAQREQTAPAVEVGTDGSRSSMVTARNEGFDHMTIVVTDLAEARRFFGLLGFEESIAVVASGEQVSDYMGIPGWESDHVTLVLKGADVHQEIQLLCFHQPPIKVDGGSGHARPDRLQPCVLPGQRPRRHARAPGGERDHAAERGPRLPRPQAGLPRRPGRRRRTGRVGRWMRP